MTFFKKVQYYLIFCFILLKPFYLWERGLPQIADYIFFIFLLCTPWNFKVKRSTIESYIIYFMSYTTIINLIFLILLPDDARRFMFSIVYILFVGLGAIKVKNELFSYPEFKSFLYKACIYTTVIQFSLLLLLPKTPGRTTLFFANPNQMGYFFLCILTLLALITSGKNSKEMIITAPVLFMNMSLIIFSQSRAALAGMVILTIAFIKINKLINPQKMLIVLILFGSIFFINENYFPDDYKFSTIITYRFESAQRKNDNSLSGRGYDRIYTYPGYLFFGGGEGGYSRYGKHTKHLQNDEIHSIIGTLLFSYGIIGFMLFINIFKVFFKKENFNFLLFFLPVIFYNLFHNGIRSQLLWIVIVIIYNEIESLNKPTTSLINKKSSFTF